MRRTILPTVILTCATAGAAPAQSHATGQSAQALIENALSAAPASVAKGATVVDHKQAVLRKGTNGWVCMADQPDVPNNSPMCLDAPWREFIDALVNKREPRFSGIGIAYMLQEDLPVSNVDPAATGPTPQNQWVQNAGPHVMVIVSDRRLLEGLPTDPANGGPWVMWKGTPYAHIMIPTPRQP